MDKDIMSVRMKKWIEIIRDATESGLTKKEYMYRNGIQRRRFYYWQKKIREYVLRENPELGLVTTTQGKSRDIRAVNSQIVSSLPVFCELKPQVRANSSTPELLSAPAFSAEAMIQYGGYQVYIDGKVSEQTLSTILAVIRHD